ncbi:hypothetical protein Q0Z83_038160 [Actinoplanes sichuanensis]|nr:hypothetical protein Q0Z83_038160 [Actinoplanes sichuanensis]
MVERLASRTDAAYRHWPASVGDDVVAEAVAVFCRESLPAALRRELEHSPDVRAHLFHLTDTRLETVWPTDIAG